MLPEEEVTPPVETPEPEATPTQTPVEEKPTEPAPEGGKGPTEEREPLTVEALTIPEGMEAPEEISAKFLELANKHGLSKDGANELIGLQAEVMKAASERNSELWQNVQEEWQAEARKDPEVGGEKLDPALADIRKLIDVYGSPELDDVFNLTGAGNNVHMVRFLKKIADAVGVEGKPVPSGHPVGQPADMAHRLFPNMP